MQDRRPTDNSGIVKVPQDESSDKDRNYRKQAYMSRFKNPHGLHVPYISKELGGSDPTLD